ncbi:hypothetical protein GS966_28690 [Rhodococcus hoagii]|nr:hypothetical protein [Prescottella equi]
MTTTETPRRRTYGGLHEAPTTYLFGVSKKTFYVFATGVGIGILLMLFGFWLFGAVVLALVLLAWAPLAIRFGGRSGYEYMSVLLGAEADSARPAHPASRHALQPAGGPDPLARDRRDHRNVVGNRQARPPIRHDPHAGAPPVHDPVAMLRSRIRGCRARTDRSRRRELG